ncbi:MAG: DNA polymerase III subunit delta [Dehalococcoidia bacterium]|nr:DNA polymerase III subunit delta [Dehalococcoidia bacterium]
MLYVFWGPDSFSIRQELVKMRALFGQPDLAGLNCMEAEASSLVPAELVSMVQTMPFLGEKRLVILHGLLAPFEPRQKANDGEAGKDSAEKGPAGSKKDTSPAVPVLEIVSNLPPTTDLVLTEEKLTPKNPVFSRLPKDATVREFPLPAGPDLERWILQAAREMGGAINSAAVHLLAENVGPDLWVLDSELRKLLLYTAGKPVTEAEVRILVSQVREASIFTLVDAVLAARAGLALGLAHKLVDGGTSPFQLFGMLARQVRLLLIAKELSSQNMSPQNMAGALGFRSPWAAKKLAQQAEGYSHGRLGAMYRRLVDEDLALKTGRRTPELGLDLLLVELCYRSDPRRPRATTALAPG